MPDYLVEFSMNFHRRINMSYFTITKQVDASELFGDDNINWHYCEQNATMAHANACEFILHLGDDKDFQEHIIEEMQAFGCTQDFIDEYRKAMQQRVSDILFYV